MLGAGTSSKLTFPNYSYISTASTNSSLVYPKSLAAWPITANVASLICTLGVQVFFGSSLLSKYLSNLLALGILALQAAAFLINSFIFSSWYPSTDVLRVTSPAMSDELARLLVLLLVPACYREPCTGSCWLLKTAVAVC